MNFKSSYRVSRILTLLLALMFTGGVGVAMADHHEKDGKQMEEEQKEQQEQAEQEGDDGYNPTDEDMGGAVDEAGDLFEGDGSDIEGM
jgi:nitrate reductase cytochrome c-type subunit